MVICFAGALQNLTDLELSGNKLTGVLQPSWAGLPNLSLLDLSDNLLNGSVPSSLFSSASLNSAFLQGNALTGIMPSVQGKRCSDACEDTSSQVEKSGAGLAAKLLCDVRFWIYECCLACCFKVWASPWPYKLLQHPRAG